MRRIGPFVTRLTTVPPSIGDPARWPFVSPESSSITNPGSDLHTYFLIIDERGNVVQHEWVE